MSAADSVSGADGGTRTQLQEEQPEAQEVLQLNKPEKDKKEDKKAVNWTEDTVDNEHLGRKKSKCCCVYVKPRRFRPAGGGDDSSSSDDSDSDSSCRDCSGHHGKDVKGGAGGKPDGDGEGQAV